MTSYASFILSCNESSFSKMSIISSNSKISKSINIPVIFETYDYSVKPEFNTFSYINSPNIFLYFSSLKLINSS